MVRIGLGITLLLGLTALVWWIFGHFNPPPLDSMKSAQKSVSKARSLGSGRRAPERIRQAESWLQQGERELSRQNGRLLPFRNYRAADSLFSLSSSAAQEAASTARNAEENLKIEAPRAYRRLMDELASWRKRLDGGLAQWEAERSWSAAKSSAEVAGRLIAGGEYERAMTNTRAGLLSLARIADLLGAYDRESTEREDTWRRWTNETLLASAKTGTSAIVVDKSAHTLYLIADGTVTSDFPCDLGYNSARQKLSAGDGATPEGKYRISKVIARGSNYYRALLLDYPNDLDRRRFNDNKSRGVIDNDARIGGLIEIHGKGGLGQDWTDGCVAISNGNLDSLMRHVRVGTPVTIVRKAGLEP